jgi:hypothetical protein
MIGGFFVQWMIVVPTILNPKSQNLHQMMNIKDVRQHLIKPLLINKNKPLKIRQCKKKPYYRFNQCIFNLPPPKIVNMILIINITALIGNVDVLRV